MKTPDLHFDFVVIGGGTSGCVIASRLSENERLNVALVEAGKDYSRGEEPREVLDTYPSSMTDGRFRWQSLRVSERDFDGSPEVPTPYTQAKVLGGGSMVMGMHALRGLPSDFDEWEAAGAKGWGWAGLWPFFKYLERDLQLKGPNYGDRGSIPMWRHDPKEWSPFALAIAEAASAEGLVQGDDINSDSKDGVYPMPYNAQPSHRVTVPAAYLTPDVRKRKNLEIITEAFALRLRFEGNRATSLEIERDGRRQYITANTFVISAGAIQSPALLLRSGVGPSEHLRSKGVEVVRDLPGVGSHLLNHPMLRIGARLKPSKRHLKHVRPHGNSVIRYSSGLDGCASSDMCILILGKSSWHKLGESIAALGVSVYKAYSEGSVRLGTPSEPATPEVQFRHLSDERDLERMIDAYIFATNLLSNPAVANLVTRKFVPKNSALISRVANPSLVNAWISQVANAAMDRSASLERSLIDLVGKSLPEKDVSRDELKHFVFSETVGMYHPAGTCKMGSDDDSNAVVAPDCKVRGLANVCVADASIMPTIPRANTFLSCVAIAEKASKEIMSSALSSTSK